jgi:hypothetical protein
VALIADRWGRPRWNSVQATRARAKRVYNAPAFDVKKKILVKRQVCRVRMGENTTHGRLLGILSIVCAVVMLYLTALRVTYRIQTMDFAEFWAAGKLVEIDPYSPSKLFALERALNPQLGWPLVMRTPPWTLPLAVPFSLMSFRAASALWMVLNIALVTGCSVFWWKQYTARNSLEPAVLSLLFGPTVILLFTGQLSALVLGGISAFVAATKERHDWLAGVSLLLVALKPQLTPLFAMAVLMWVVRNGRWKVLAGAAISLGTSSAVALLLNHGIFAQYYRLIAPLRSSPEVCPNLAGLLNEQIGGLYIMLVPLVVGTAWLMVYWRRHRKSWQWAEHTPLLLLVSLLTTLYGFSYDEILLLPVIMGLAAVGQRKRFYTGYVVMATAYLAYLFGNLGRYGIGYMFLSWTTTAWMLLYLVAEEPADASLASAKATI